MGSCSCRAISDEEELGSGRDAESMHLVATDLSSLLSLSGSLSPSTSVALLEGRKPFVDEGNNNA